MGFFVDLSVEVCHDEGGAIGADDGEETGTWDLDETIVGASAFADVVVED